MNQNKARHTLQGKLVILNKNGQKKIIEFLLEFVLAVLQAHFFFFCSCSMRFYLFIRVHLCFVLAYPLTAFLFVIMSSVSIFPAILITFQTSIFVTFCRGLFLFRGGVTYPNIYIIFDYI